MSDNLGTILAGFNGVVAVVGNTVGLAGPVGKEIGAGFQIVNGVIVATIGSTESTSADDIAKLEAAAVGLLADILAGAFTTTAVMTLGGGALAIIGAGGVVAVLTQAGGDDIYAGYQWAKDKAFGIVGWGNDFMNYFLNATLSSPPSVEVAFITLDGISYHFNAQGEIVSMSAGDLGTGPTTDSFTITTNPDLATEQTEASDPTSAVSEDNSTLIDNGIYQVLGLGNVNTVTGNQQAANATLSDMWMPGANQVLEADLWANVKENYLDQTAYDYSGAYANQQATGATQWTPVDPLILDLNGDGVRLTSFAEAPVLFDIDHDGGSKEITGWVSGEDGIVVMDLNGNGLIDGIHETMSEYFNGTVGSDGEAGSKPYSDGFAALKSLDSNGDNLFTSADTAWSSVKVWQDANHDGPISGTVYETIPPQTVLGTTQL